MFFHKLRTSAVSVRAIGTKIESFDDDIDDIYEIKLEDVQLLFYGLLILYLVAIIIFIIEHITIIHKYSVRSDIISEKSEAIVREVEDKSL